MNEGMSARLAMLKTASPYFAGLVAGGPDVGPGSAEALPAKDDAPPDPGLELAGCQQALRAAKRAGLARVIWWELGLSGDIAASARALSAWADGLLESALTMAERLTAERYGALPGGSFAVVGLGKLGGCELNLGSDVDLLFLWQAPAGAMSDGRRSVSAGEYYPHLARMLIRLMGERTVDGACWKMDMRLRPGGDGAPICLNLDATLSHYQEYGQTWERAMLVKAETDNVVVARSIAGLPASHEDEALAPTSTGLARARKLASVLGVHRITHAIELSVLILIAAIIDTIRGDLLATRVLVVTCLVVAALMVAAHLVAIMASRRLR